MAGLWHCFTHIILKMVSGFWWFWFPKAWTLNLKHGPETFHQEFQALGEEIGHNDSWQERQVTKMDT